MNLPLSWPVIALLGFTLLMTLVVIAKRLRQRRPAGAGVAMGASPESEEVFGTLTQALGEQLPIRRSTAQELTKELRLAGYYRPTALSEYNALRFVLLFAVCVGFGLLAILMPATATRQVLVVGLAAAALALGLPRVVLMLQGRRRVQAILRGLPDAVDLINMGVSRGLTFQTAFERAQGKIRAIHPELSRELEIVQQQSRIGSLENALRQLDRRVDCPEIRSLTGTLAQTERLGTSVSAALETYAASVRTTLKQNAEHAASTAPFKLLFPIVLCMVPAVYMILLGPAALEITNFVRNRNSTLGTPRQDLTRISSTPISTPSSSVGPQQ